MAIDADGIVDEEAVSRALAVCPLADPVWLVPGVFEAVFAEE